MILVLYLYECSLPVCYLTPRIYGSRCTVCCVFGSDLLVHTCTDSGQKPFLVLCHTSKYDVEVSIVDLSLRALSCIFVCCLPRSLFLFSRQTNKVAQDIIWVWAENGPDAGLESALAMPALIPDLSDVEGLKSGRVVPAPIGHRDLAYGWDTFVENVVVSGQLVLSLRGWEEAVGGARGGGGRV